MLRSEYTPTRGAWVRRSFIAFGFLFVLSATAVAKTKLQDIEIESQCVNMGYDEVSMENRTQIIDALTSSLADEGWTCKSSSKTKDLPRCERTASGTLNADDAPNEIWRAQTVCKALDEGQYKAFFTVINLKKKTRLYGAYAFHMNTTIATAADTSASN